MARVGIVSPWVNYYREVEALFKDDPEVKVVYNEEENNLKLYVSNQKKADALAQLLPFEKQFGNVTLTIEVVPGNLFEDSDASLFRVAFDGNPALAYTKTITGIFTNPINYVVFKNKVVQYFNDDLGDINGLRSTLYQELAKDVFENQNGVYFCTDTEEPVY